MKVNQDGIHSRLWSAETWSSRQTPVMNESARCKTFLNLRKTLCGEGKFYSKMKFKIQIPEIGKKIYEKLLKKFIQCKIFLKNY